MECVGCGKAFEAHVFPGATARCPGCGAENRVGGEPRGRPAEGPYRTPDAPIVVPAGAGASPGRPLGPLCPRCTRLLSGDEGACITCARCHGCLVAHDELASRIEEARPAEPPADPPRHAHDVPPEPAVHYARCPHCARPMTRMNFGGRSGIIVDVCDEHGTWFDGGELPAALTFVREGGIEAQLAAPPPAPRKSEEAEAMLRVAQAELRAEAAKQDHAIEQFTSVVSYLFLRGKGRW